MLRNLCKIALLPVLLPSCALLQDNVRDPGTLVPVASVLKSLRCEAITYLVANRFRQKEFKRLSHRHFAEAFKKYASLPLDDHEYGAIETDLQAVDHLGLSLGMDWKTHVQSSSFHDWHIGPSLDATKTYVRSNVFALPQDADLGPETGKNQNARKFYADAHRQDANYFCYTSKSGNPHLSLNMNVAEMLVRNELPQFDNYKRIMVDGHLPLARWLEIKGSQMVKNAVAENSYLESLLPAQLNYSFALEVRPSFDFKYTLVATVINPEVPEFSASSDNTSTFFIYLNTKYALAAYGAKSGSANITPPSTPVIWGPKPPSKKPPSKALPVRPLIVRRPPVPAKPMREPGVGITAPLGIATPTNQ